MLKVSIIVPVFNGEKYIEDLIISLRKQTLSEIEIIFVDDGSTDKTSEIIKKFIMEDERIRYIYQTNQGGGGARNTGIENANAPYLICIDADDLYEENMAELLYNKAVSCDTDIAICQYKIWNQTTGRISGEKGINHKILPKKEVFSSEDVPNILQVANPGPCNKLYKKSFVQENNLKYSDTRIINDLKFGMIALCIAKRIAVVSEDLSTYKYQIQGSGSKNREQKMECSFKVFREIYEEFLKFNLFDKFKESYYHKIIDSLKYEISFPVSERFIGLIKTFFSEKPMSDLTKEELKELFRVRKLKKNIFEYTMLSILTLGLNKSVQDKLKNIKQCLNNLKELGLV